MVECTTTNSTDRDRGTDTDAAHHHANDTHLRMVIHKQGHLHCSACASANTTFGKIGTGLHIVVMNSQSRVPPLAERGTRGFHDQRTGGTKTTDETDLHHLEKEKDRHIETGIMKDIDRPATTIVAAAKIGAVVEAGAAAREGIDPRTMEAHLVEK